MLSVVLIKAVSPRCFRVIWCGPRLPPVPSSARIHGKMPDCENVDSGIGKD